MRQLRQIDHMTGIGIAIALLSGMMRTANDRRHDDGRRQFGNHGCMLFAPGDQFCGVPAEMARQAARVIESVQWCSAGVLARELAIGLPASRRLLRALEDDGRVARYDGMLPPGHDGAWLPGEETGEEPLMLWHLRYPEGKALAKARIGPAVSRSQAEDLLADVLARVRVLNDDPAGSHIVEHATLIGSLTDPARHEVGDVDLIVYARRRCHGVPPPGTGGEHGLTDMAGLGARLSGDEAAGLRMSLEALLRAGDERLDVSVVDESSDNPRPVPSGAVEREVFRREPSAGGTAV
jgi:hypothetical protein